MNARPGREQNGLLAGDLDHRAPDIGVTQPLGPDELRRPAERAHLDLCLTTWADRVYVRRAVIIGVDDKPEPMGTMNRRY
jgi:hypothetical protein